MLNISKARILLSNDDGFDAEGLNLLRRLIESVSGEVWVVAPDSEQSGVGHSLTLRRPLRIRERGKRLFSVDGTPTDCVLLAINHIMADTPPDLVLTGINYGANLGEDVTYSGTIGAALEATILGIPAIAFSQQLSMNSETNWRNSENSLIFVLNALIKTGWPQDTVMNVNFPSGYSAKDNKVLVTRQGRRKKGDYISQSTDPSGRDYFWIGKIKEIKLRDDGTDIAALARGKISITPLGLDLTDNEAIFGLRKTLG